MKKLIFLIVSVSFLFTILYSRNSDAAIMEDYCVAPPYVIQNVPPNIMIVLDNSGSMFNFAYSDGFNTTTRVDDNDCDGVDEDGDGNGTVGDDADTTAACSGFATPGTYPTYKYYGYFNPDYWYTYSSRFTPAAAKTGVRPPNSWDGNFLNWLTMRRVDIIKKVMTGGRGTPVTSPTRLRGEQADGSGRGIYKSTIAADTPNYTQYTGAKTYTFSTGGAGTSQFTVSGGGTFNVEVDVLPSALPVEGVLQRAVGAKARIGLTFYRPNTGSDDGGYVRVAVGGGSLSSTIAEINLSRPDSNTPLAETLWTVTGYFAQDLTIEGSPGPRYASGDFQINNTNDPLNYGTGGQPVYRSCGKSFVLYITDGEPCADGNLPATLSNYASGKSDYNCSGSSCPAVDPPGLASFSASTFPACPKDTSTYCTVTDPPACTPNPSNVAGIEDVALYAHTTDLRSATIGSNAIDGTQNLSMYFVFAFGKGSTLLRYAAINGGFEDSIPYNGIPDLTSEWDNNEDGEPDNFYEATDGAELETSIEAAFSTMLRRASSGTAASVLASGEGRGANLLQAVFYPRRAFGNDVIGWTGSLQNLWYYVDPLFTYSNIREDTTADEILNLQDDYIIRLYFDPGTAAIPPVPPSTKAKRYIDSNGDGAPDSQIDTVKFEDIGSLWEAGKLLWSRDIAANPRKIYTTINGTSFLSNDFSVTNAAALASYLQAASTTEAENIIKYTHGEDITLDTSPADGVNDFRARTVTIGSETHVWKLGDILDSTPKISSWVPLNKYDKVYKDPTYASFVATTTTTTPPVNYKGRGMVFAGANDGMLHAFNLGLLEEKWTGQGSYEKARLTGADLGKEKWAFIPKNVLPYLKYIADPDYCHVFNVDLTPFIFDASIGGNAGDAKPADGSSWRTVLIGGMRTGGACRGTTTACTSASGEDRNGDNVADKDCVNTPVDVGGASVGYSSYFAIDITDQDNPVLLWEFSDPQLGFATTGPAVVRIGDANNNGDWFVIFGSGPTGPISTQDTQFMGRSDQNLRLFIFNLKTGPGINNADVVVKDTNIQNAFAGSMIYSAIDTDLNYKDDAVYIGYTKLNTADGGASATARLTNPYKWTQGGVGRLLTKENADPTQWAWSLVMDNIGPVTSAVAKLESTKNKILWLYFGTGRSYFAKADSIDDQTNQRALYGVKEPCFTSTGVFNLSCTSSVGSLTNVTNIASIPSESTANGAGFNGWYINLDASGSYTYAEGDPAVNVTRNYGAERVITDTVSTTTGCVFFVSYKPYTDVCAIGGKSFLWAARYNTGGTCAIRGKALLQVSTGSIEDVDPPGPIGRKSDAMEGVPPTGGGLALQTPPAPVKKIQHIRER